MKITTTHGPKLGIRPYPKLVTCGGVTSPIYLAQEYPDGVYGTVVGYMDGSVGSGMLARYELNTSASYRDFEGTITMENTRCVD